jgi:hypothetical protein
MRAAMRRDAENHHSGLRSQMRDGATERAV